LRAWRGVEERQRERAEAGLAERIARLQEYVAAIEERAEEQLAGPLAAEARSELRASSEAWRRAGSYLFRRRRAQR